jgi:ABC-type oligopeptide transport system ATPase subunit
MQNIVEVKNLTKTFKLAQGIFSKKKALIKAVDDVTFSIKAGSSLGLVGESGSGKTTCGRLILNLLKADRGQVLIKGINAFSKDTLEIKKIRRSAQIIFQDPYDSLNPRMSIKDILLEGVRIFNLYSKKEEEKRLKELLELVGLAYQDKDKYPHQFSGGQRQRVAIARALSVEPEFIVCDEAVSSLDMSIRAQILNLLKELQKELNLSYLFISHDLPLVEYFCSEVAVMYQGKIVELASSKEIYNNPLHPYTKILLQAGLAPEPETRKLKIDVKRFEYKPDKEEKALREHSQGHWVRG